MFNYVDFYRFNEQTEDVFLEDGAYLYASAEPFGRPYMLACNPYKIEKDKEGRLLYTRCDTVGADAAYLDGLQRAPEDIARQIIMIEHARAERFYEMEVCA